MSKLLDYHKLSCRYYDPKRLEVKRVLKLLNGLKGKRVLEVGCGIGRLSSELPEFGAKVTGVDIDRLAIRYCKRNFRSKNLRFKVADARKLPFEDATFDVVLYPWMGNLGRDLTRAISETKRVLRSGGKIIVIEELGGSDYMKVIGTFVKSQGESSDSYVKRLRNSVIKCYNRIVSYKKMDVPYVFPNLDAAYKMMTYDLEYFRGRKLSKKDKIVLNRKLLEFASGKKIVLNESVAFISCTKLDKEFKKVSYNHRQLS